MPRLCVLVGLVIWVNTRDHMPPHFHVRLSGAEVRASITDLSVLTPASPGQVCGQARGWACAKDCRSRSTETWV